LLNNKDKRISNNIEYLVSSKTTSYNDNLLIVFFESFIEEQYNLLFFYYFIDLTKKVFILYSLNVLRDTINQV